MFIIYPSALFLHFNYDVTRKCLSLVRSIFSAKKMPELQLVVAHKGEAPTPDNTRPIHEGNTAECGRGSMVWFTQATMLQTAELPYATVKETRARAGKDDPSAGQFDAAAAFDDDFFPRAI